MHEDFEMPPYCDYHDDNGLTRNHRPVPINSIYRSAEAASRIIEGISALGKACSDSVDDTLTPAQRVWITGMCYAYSQILPFAAELADMIDEVENK